MTVHQANVMFVRTFLTDSLTLVSLAKLLEVEKCIAINLLWSTLMTGNQIAYMSAVEQRRHDKAYEEETALHNRNSETISEEANRINLLKVQYENANAQDRNNIQSRYNDAYIEYLNASTQRKLELEKEMNELKREMNEIDRQYKQNVVSLQNRENEIKQQQANELERHNQAMEGINSEQNRINEERNKWDKEYRYHELDVHSGLKLKELQLAKERNDNELLLGQNRNEINLIQTQNQFDIQQEANDLRRYELGLKKQETTSSVFWKPFQMLKFW